MLQARIKAVQKEVEPALALFPGSECFRPEYFLADQDVGTASRKVNPQDLIAIPRSRGLDPTILLFKYGALAYAGLTRRPNTGKSMSASKGTADAPANTACGEIPGMPAAAAYFCQTTFSPRRSGLTRKPLSDKSGAVPRGSQNRLQRETTPSTPSSGLGPECILSHCGVFASPAPFQIRPGFGAQSSSFEQNITRPGCRGR
jgi:hypothetical protein